MIDLTSAGNRAMDTLDSMSDMQMAMRVAPMKNDFSSFMKNIKLSGKAMQVVDNYLKSPSHLKSLPIRIWHPVKNGEKINFHVPGDNKALGTLSHQLFKQTDSRVFRASMEESCLSALAGIRIKKSGNDFLYS